MKLKFIRENRKVPIETLFSQHVPRLGDYVSIKDTVYSIINILTIYDLGEIEEV